MFVGTLVVHIQLGGISSLKQKRGIVKSVIGRIKSRFNASAAEVDRHDNKQLAVIGLAVVANESVFANQQLDKIMNFIDRDGRFYVGHVEREVFSD